MTAPDRATTADEPTGGDEPGDDDLEERLEERAERWRDRLERPALVAALASIPAVFLTLLADGTLETTGRVIDLAAAAVLVVEGLLPLVLARDRRRWLREHWWVFAIAVAIVPLVLLVTGPAQILRLVRSVGALRILRVRRIVKAGKVVGRHLGPGRGRRIAASLLSVVAAAFVAVVLTDPTVASDGLARRVLDTVGPIGVVAAGLVLAGATYLVMRERDDDDEDDGDQDDDQHVDDQDDTTDDEPGDEP